MLLVWKIQGEGGFSHFSQVSRSAPGMLLVFWERGGESGSRMLARDVMDSVAQPSNCVMSRMGGSKLPARASLIPPVTTIQLPVKSVKADLSPNSHKTSPCTGKIHQTCDQLPVSDHLPFASSSFSTENSNPVGYKVLLLLGRSLGFWVAGKQQIF